MKSILLSFLAVLACAALLVACGPDPDMRMQVSSSAPARVDSRVSVERIGVIEDGLAYGNRRGVYIIRDSKTGVEFIGVSGVGIAETGSHNSGKTSTRDER